METLNVGIIGAGGIAQKLHLPDIARTPGLQVTAIQGRKEHRLRPLAERFDVPRITTDAGAILADDSIQGVIIATPHPQHVSAGLAALQAGKHVFMQKPLCGDMAEADSFAAAVEAYGGDLPPGTESPALTEMGEYVAVAVREALLADPQPDAVLHYIELAPYDTAVLEACLAHLARVHGGRHPAIPLLKARLSVARG